MKYKVRRNKDERICGISHTGRHNPAGLQQHFVDGRLPYFPKSCCTLIESGVCEGGPGIGKFYAELKKKYDADITEEEETARIRRWEHDRMFAKKELIGGTKNE